MSIQKLPPEVISIVFSHIDGLYQLAECRLTCKAWETIAERAMLEREIYLFSSYQIGTLVEFLKRHPKNARLIKHLTFDSSEDLSLLDIEASYELLKLAFTPNIEVVRGTVGSSCFQGIVEIAQNSHEKFNKLEEIPHSFSRSDDRDYYTAAYEFRNSLKQLSLYVYCSPDRVVFHFEKFKCLTQLTLYGYSATLGAINDCLHQCHYLEYLSMHLSSMRPSYLDSASIRDTMPEELTAQWINDKKVQKETTYITIEYSHVYDRPDIIEYLVYKYPNMKKMAFTNELKTSIHNFPIRYLRALKNIPVVYLGSTCFQTEDILTELAGRASSLA